MGIFSLTEGGGGNPLGLSFNFAAPCGPAGPASEGLPLPSGLASPLFRDGLATARPFRIMVRKGSHVLSPYPTAPGTGVSLGADCGASQSLGCFL